MFTSHIATPFYGNVDLCCLDIIIDLEEHFRLWVSEDKMKSFDNIDDIVEYFDKADLI